jgi:hypothetical protein
MKMVEQQQGQGYGNLKKMINEQQSLKRMVKPTF